MNTEQLKQMYNFQGKTAVVTGGAGVLCSEMCIALAGCNAKVAILGRNPELAEKLRQRILSNGNTAIVVKADVLDVESLKKAAEEVLKAFGSIDILINGAGGNNPKATTNPEQSFFNIPPEAMRFVFDLNIMGTVLPTQVFAKHMAQQKEGVILNISSMNAFRPLTRIPAYSAAKAGVSNFTQWLAVHLAQEYSPNIRVNAIAPGFFLTDQNRFLLTDKETGELTARGKKILDHTPMGRFGASEDLLGGTLWLVSEAAKFVTGIVLPIDGGFSAYSGV
jgi:NAD(P)-dependent dehydrogenase (short-subunit alcohol dehydrogenase family)